MNRITKHSQTIILVLFALYALAPVYLVLLASMRSESDLFDGPLSLPWPIETANYVRVWTESGFSVSVAPITPLRRNSMAAGRRSGFVCAR